MPHQEILGKNKLDGTPNSPLSVDYEYTQVTWYSLEHNYTVHTQGTMDVTLTTTGHRVSTSIDNRKPTGEIINSTGRDRGKYKKRE